MTYKLLSAKMNGAHQRADKKSSDLTSLLTDSVHPPSSFSLSFSVHDASCCFFLMSYWSCQSLSSTTVLSLCACGLCASIFCFNLMVVGLHILDDNRSGVTLFFGKAPPAPVLSVFLWLLSNCYIVYLNSNLKY